MVCIKKKSQVCTTCKNLYIFNYSLSSGFVCALIRIPHVTKRDFFSNSLGLNKLAHTIIDNRFRERKELNIKNIHVKKDLKYTLKKFLMYIRFNITSHCDIWYISSFFFYFIMLA